MSLETLANRQCWQTRTAPAAKEPIAASANAAVPGHTTSKGQRGGGLDRQAVARESEGLSCGSRLAHLVHLDGVSAADFQRKLCAVAATHHELVCGGTGTTRGPPAAVGLQASQQLLSLVDWRSPPTSLLAQHLRIRLRRRQAPRCQLSGLLSVLTAAEIPSAHDRAGIAIQPLPFIPVERIEKPPRKRNVHDPQWEPPPACRGPRPGTRVLLERPGRPSREAEQQLCTGPPLLVERARAAPQPATQPRRPAGLLS